MTRAHVLRQAQDERFLLHFKVEFECFSTSVYRWNGAVQHADEWALLIKTSEQEREQLEHAIVQHHEYECPAIMCWQAGSSEFFARWVEQELGR